jgi:hypothetical protein
MYNEVEKTAEKTVMVCLQITSRHSQGKSKKKKSNENPHMEYKVVPLQSMLGHRLK